MSPRRCERGSKGKGQTERDRGKGEVGRGPWTEEVAGSDSAVARRQPGVRPDVSPGLDRVATSFPRCNLILVYLSLLAGSETALLSRWSLPFFLILSFLPRYITSSSQLPFFLRPLLHLTTCSISWTSLIVNNHLGASVVKRRTRLSTT